jgi:hypothetical protein
MMSPHTCLCKTQTSEMDKRNIRGVKTFSSSSPKLVF